MLRTIAGRFILYFVVVLFAVGPSTPALAQTSCSFAGELEVAPEAMMRDSDPVLGNSSADVLLIEFFDPNCSHCQRFHSVMKGVMEEYGDQVKYYKHPIPVWQYSVRQIEAMFLAREKGKYYEMIDQQMENPTDGEMSVGSLARMADSIGIDPEWMRNQLNEHTMQKEVGRTSFMARQAGVENTPTLAIEGKIVSPKQPTSCIGRLIEQTLQKEASSESE